MVKKISITFLFLSIIISSCLFVAANPSSAATAKTYTLDADFDQGTMVGVEHETVHNQLQLSTQNVTLPFIWVPNSNEGTISKISTEPPYKELGRYRVAPTNKGLPSNGDPSRTTVALDGSCWVGNRQAGTVVKVGLLEAGQWIDRNGDGICQTSRDQNNDGVITGNEILPWGQDECVLYEVVLISGHEGTFVPGTYTGPYDTNYWGVSPRGLAIDKNNNLWAGTYSTQKYFHINGSTGQIISGDTINVAPWGHSAYGAVMDKNGILWSASLSSHVLKINPSNLAETMKININSTYGLGLDYNGHLFVAGGGRLVKIDIANNTTPIMWNKAAYTERGVACTSDNDVWVVSTSGGSVSRYDNDGNFKIKINVGGGPTGVSVDSNGMVWVCDNNDYYVKAIDPATNTVIAQKATPGGTHYSYSDMTGIVARTITTKIGTWEAVYDSGAADTLWDKISWTSSETNGSSITVQTMSSNDGVNYSVPENVTNGAALITTPKGRYLKVKATFNSGTGDVSPILYDLTVYPKETISQMNWNIYKSSQLDTGNDWTCDPCFTNMVQSAVNSGQTTITLQDTNGDGKKDTAVVTVKNAYPTYYNSVTLGVINIGTVTIDMSKVKITDNSSGVLNIRLLEGASTVIAPGTRRAIGIDFRVMEGAAPGEYSFTISL